MVFDILAVIGLREAGSFLAKDVLLPLLQGSLEDYAKDFFKGSIADAVGLASQEPVQKALGKALKVFVDLVEEELEFQGSSGAEIRDFYEAPLRQFMKDADVKATLGQAFEPDCRQIDADVLPLRWQSLGLHPLPDEFDWPQIGKKYVREVKGILRSSPDLVALLTLHNQEAMRRGIDELVGIPPDFDLRKYQETLREQYGNLKLESLDTSAYAYNDLKLWRMFIPQDVRTCQEFNPRVYEIPKDMFKELQQRGELDAEALEAAQIEDYRRSYVEQPIQNVLELVGRTAGYGQRSRAGADHAVVLGDPGSGKSTLLQYVALQWAEQPVGDLKELAQRPLPLLIELRKYARDRHDNKCSSMVEYLHKGDIACRLNQQRLDEVLKAGDAIALFDGIDEVFDPTLREVVVTDIHRFTNDYPQVQVIATSRWLGYKAQPLRDAGFQHYMLQDLSDEQIADFIERWHDQTFAEGADKVRKRDRLHKAIRDSKAIRELAGNPLLLTMMAILNRNQELPRDRPKLYERASEVLLHQWDVERNLIEQRLDPMTIDYRDKQAMLRKVACHMQSGTKGLAGNIISAQDLEVILVDYLRSIDIDKPREVARLMIRQLRERNFILCYLGADNYAFVHRTFLEFFAAWAFVWEFKETQKLSLEKLKNNVYGSHWREESWREVLRLISGMIDAQFVANIIEFLLAQELNLHEFLSDEPKIYVVYADPIENSKNKALTRNAISNLLLAVNCLYEARPRSPIVRTSNKLLKSLQIIIETEHPYRFGEEAADEIMQTIATTWNEDNEVLFWMKSCIKLDSYSCFPEASIKAISQAWRDFETQKWLKEVAKSSPNKYVRQASILEIAREFKGHADTLLWLKKNAQQDKDQYVRQAAVQSLAREFKDIPDTVAILKTSARQDKDDNVRQAAVRELAREFKDDSEILPWLKRCAQEVGYYDVRKVAVQELARGFKDDPDTIVILKASAQSNDHQSVQMAAIQELAKGFKDDPDTIEILKMCVQNHKDDDVRVSAMQELAKYFKDDPDTIVILKMSVQQDKDSYVRQAAMRMLNGSFGDDPDTAVILKMSAQQDENSLARIAAIHELAKGFKDDCDIVLILKRLIKQDAEFNVRKAAVQEFARGFKDEPDTLQYLKTLAQHDVHDDVREAAMQELARGWKEDKDLLGFWHDRTINDPYKRSEWDFFGDNPRQIALNILVQKYPDHPKTLKLLQDRAHNDSDSQLKEWAAQQLAKLEQ